MEFLIMIDIFSMFFFELEIHYRDWFEQLNPLTKMIFANRVLPFLNKLVIQIKNSSSVKKIKIRIKIGKKIKRVF